MTDPNVNVSLHLRIPAWVKELVAEAAAAEGMAVAQYCAHVLAGCARDTIGIPEPPPAVAALPTVSDVLRTYIEGSKMIGPCGNAWPCEYSEEASKFIGDAEFCGSCNVRVH